MQLFINQWMEYLGQHELISGHRFSVQDDVFVNIEFGFLSYENGNAVSPVPVSQMWPLSFDDEVSRLSNDRVIFLCFFECLNADFFSLGMLLFHDHCSSYSDRGWTHPGLTLMRI